ncbi:hypothetical protein NQ315_006398 [Exocentrus adspersus]|uniref:Breast cancer type 2 susceptibility protein n=1 Tax=Exocentrus adspersus TaxID=1586481 RepID=A0AAV8VZW1_9CUCU|nr:hypothetical protein NQ315_006398 [Exocentrus adspersus]
MASLKPSSKTPGEADVQEEPSPSSSCKERPLSPVLTGGMSNRKFLIGRRLNRNRSATRTKLSDRFNESSSKPLVVDPIIDIPTPLNDSLSITQTEILVDHLNKLEELEKKRNDLYKAFVRSKKENDKLKTPKPRILGLQNSNTENSKDMNKEVASHSFTLNELVSVPSKELTSSFQTASGKDISVSEADIVKHSSKIFNDIINPDTQAFVAKADSATHFNASTGFSTASGSRINVSNSAMVQAKQLFEAQTAIDTENTTKEVSVNAEEPELSLTQAIFESGISNTQMMHVADNVLSSLEVTREGFNGFSKEVALESRVKATSFGMYLKQVTNRCCGTPGNGTLTCIANKGSNGSTSASGKSISVSERNLEDAYSRFSDVDVDFPVTGNAMKSAVGFKRASGASIKISETALTNAQNVFESLGVDDGVATTRTFSENRKRPITELQEQKVRLGMETIEDETCYIKRPRIVQESVGFSKASGKAIQVSETAMKQAKSIFDNLSVDDVAVAPKPAQWEQGLPETTPVKANNLPRSVNAGLSARSSRKKLGVSHCKQIQISSTNLDKARRIFNEDFSKTLPSVNTSTPVHQNPYSTPVRNDCFKPSRSFSSFVEVTPVKATVAEQDTACGRNADILFTSPSNTDWMQDLEAAKKKLEDRLRVLSQRQTLGQQAKSQSDTRFIIDKPRQGVLYRAKTNTRISLNSFVGGCKPGTSGLGAGFPVSAKNAENLHFRNQIAASVLTEDGAVVIPNVRDTVGLSEIGHAFESMPGVEPRLIPKNWIRNHYKWIVWKLTSYENMFPAHFQGCLSIENIVQQLKYRYDREIDRAERSALRRIYEKDDASQKRLVLFVSDIKTLQTPKKYELELSDGWYSVRTIIDDPLCQQITNGKIKIGTKLITSGAELLNCDGCYPLESTDLVCLKISYNSTRRAVWYAKLGFQRCPHPFPIQLQGIHPNGGAVRAVKICIVRVYPLRYIQRLNGHSVCRNKKAEELAAQKWENERIKELERIQDDVRKKFEASHTKPGVEKVDNADISGITCPKQLHELLEKSNDPECFQENLSGAQREAILRYKNDLFMRKQQEMVAEMKETVAKSKLVKRDVSAVLKLLVFDANDSGRPFNFFVWRPSETHLQSLREGKSFTVQNVLPKTNGDLNSNMKTTFKAENVDDCRCGRYSRRLTRFSQLLNANSTVDFNEFDTVGIVVQTKVEAHNQEVWMTDNTTSLLHITINEGPGTCLLLDNLKRGQVTTVCNLAYRGWKENTVRAVGDQFTVFSSYSQHRHLQEGLEAVKRETNKDLQDLLKDCDGKIEMFRIISDIKNSFSEDFEQVDEKTVA